MYVQARTASPDAPPPSQYGGLAVAVPGLLAGHAALLERFGTQPLADLVEPARRLAAEGFAVDDKYLDAVERVLADLGRYPDLRPMAAVLQHQFLFDGRPVKPGAILRQLEFARTLALIGSHGLDRFYRGPIGLATVLAFYFLAREMFGVPAAQIGTFLLAISRWHVHFSRIAFVEIVPVPLVEILVIYFLWRGLRGGRRSNYVFAELSFGLGFHTYIGYRIFPLIIGLYLLHLVVSRRGLMRKHLIGLAIFALATFMTSSFSSKGLPM